MGYHKWKACIDACLKCAAVCDYCAISCTHEENIKMMARCIELDMQCSSLCYTAARLITMGSPYARQLCAICAELCHDCAEECSKHYNDHCRECAEACNRCANECRKMAA